MAETGVPTVLGTWKKLRRRKVVQWGLGYVAVAWGVVQGIAFAAGTFHWPELVTRVSAVLALTGLPVAITLAWFHGDRGEQRVTGVEVALLATLVAIGTFLVGRELRDASAPVGAATARAVGNVAGHADPHRIAILPFDNLGADPANAAFVGGVHDTLITQVARIPGLSVISRSSVLQFADKHPTMAEVAAALDVGTVLEGSVEREGDTLRIQAQLIDARTDSHVWAETYDRSARDLFAVQSEIAQAVAEQLRIRLTSADAHRLTAQLSSNPQAYEHYVLGRDYAGRAQWPQAIQELTIAVTLDPGFAAAYAYLSLARTWQGFFDQPTRAANLPLARDAARKALELDPTLPEGHLAMAVYLYRGEPNVEGSAAEFQRAIAGLPNDALAHQNFGFLRRWQGRWEEAAALFARAEELDPQGTAYWAHVMALVALGRREEAAKVVAAAQVLHPDDADLALGPGDLAMNFSCDLATTESVYRNVAARLPGTPELLQPLAYFALMTGDTPAALDYADRLPQGPETSDYGRDFLRALIYRVGGRRSASDEVSQAFLHAITQEIRGLSVDETHSDTLAWIGAQYALLGNAKSAQMYVDRALRALPPAGDAANRTETRYVAAIALAWAQDPRGAVGQLKQVLDAPGWPKPAFIWCDPFLAPLRPDPGFRELLSRHGADLSIDPHRRETWPKR